MATEPACNLHVLVSLVFSAAAAAGVLEGGGHRGVSTRLEFAGASTRGSLPPHLAPDAPVAIGSCTLPDMRWQFCPCMCWHC